MPKGGEQFGSWYDHTAADKAVKFFTIYLRHTEGEWLGRPFFLSPWQEEIVRTIFGWKRADGTRLVRQVYIEVPRGNGKTEFAAGLTILVMAGDGEPGGQGFSMACSKEQVEDTIFKKVGVMIQLSESLKKDFIVWKKKIICPALGAEFKPLSTKASTKHGFSPSFAVGDELHEWPDGEIHDVVHKGTGKRRQPLEVLITTAGRPGVGYGWEMHERAEQVISGAVTDPTFYAVIFAADPKDDWRDPETHKKANPNYGISIKGDYLATEAVQAEGNVRKIADFKRYHLGIWNEEVVGGIKMEHWDACPARPVKLEDMKGRECYAALDLSTTTDLTSLTLLFPWENKKGFDAWWHFWMPSANIEERVKHDRVRYDQWIADGFITATEGETVDYDVIRAMISGGVSHPSVTAAPITSLIKIKELALDRWNATQLAQQLTNDGVKMVAFGQGFASMSAPSKELERLLGTGAINHGGNPVARWMASCTVFSSDPADNIKPVKPERRRSVKRIDGIVTLIMGIGRAIVLPDEPPAAGPFIV